jgi:hypothetical protein
MIRANLPLYSKGLFMGVLAWGVRGIEAEALSD